MKNKFTILNLILLLFLQKSFAQTDPIIFQVINEVNADSLMENLKILSGEKSIVLNSEPIKITSRHKDNIGNIYAANFIYNKLNGYNLTTFRQNFLTTGQNIYAYQYGKENPNQYVIICAHYDDMPPGSIAPGADDNGSGTAAVLEAARILSKYETKYTIIYALWDQEEQGLQGSDYFALQAKAKNDDIKSVINLDMIGWDSNNDGLMEIHTQNYASSNQLAEFVREVNNIYNIGLFPIIIDPGTTRSDHYSFWIRNYSAILLIENLTIDSNGVNDFNSYYHTTLDNIQIINKGYFQKIGKLAIGALAVKAVVHTDATQPIIPSSYFLYQNYPNPFNTITTIKFSIKEEAHVKLTVYDMLGKEVMTLVDEVKSSNYYYIKFDASKAKNVLSSGVYFYALYAGNYICVQKMVFAK